MRTDVTSREDCSAQVDTTMTGVMGGVDILVNSAVAAPRCPPLADPEQFRSVIDINLNGCYWMAKACARVMQPGISIINVTSVRGLTTLALPQAAYVSSKAGYRAHS